MDSSLAIVGGGLVGSLWAVLLRQKGYRVSVYEKRADPRRTGAEGGRSINLVITSRGLHGLEKAGLREAALKLSVPVSGRMIHGRAGAPVYQPYGTEKECNYSISRAGLNAFLLDAAEKAGAELHFGHALEALEPETATLTFATPEGERNRSFDVVFGTDGAGSAVRRLLVNHSPAAFSESVDWLEADYKELFIPLRHGKPALEKNALHIWPRGNRMMMALANQDGSFTVTLYLPKRGEGSFLGLQSPEQVEAYFHSEFPDAVKLLPDYARDFFAHAQGALGTVRCPRWVFRGKVALMGDAAHAIVPFFGQGMNSGFEDCTALSNLIGAFGGRWNEILEHYETLQRPNAEAIAAMAIENWEEMRDKVGDARFQLRKKTEAWLEKQFPGFYKSRYGLITYTLVPYATARAAGQIQDRLLGKLCEGIQSPEELKREAARALLEAEWAPFVKMHQLDLT